MLEFYITILIITLFSIQNFIFYIKKKKYNPCCELYLEYMLLEANENETYLVIILFFSSSTIKKKK